MSRTASAAKREITPISTVIFTAGIVSETVAPILDSSVTSDTVQRKTDVTSDRSSIVF